LAGWVGNSQLTKRAMTGSVLNILTCSSSSHNEP
jgi:hypothetical protein